MTVPPENSGGNAPPSLVDVPGAPPTPAPAAIEPSFPSNWCDRAGLLEIDRVDTIGGIASMYYDAQKSDCSTSKLTATFDEQQDLDWSNYLFDYTNAMTGCPMFYGPVEGGILAFGPGNTPIIGVDRPRLGRDDVTGLINSYLMAFAGALALSDGERSAVEAHLWRTAEPDIDSAASATLSACP